MHESATSLLLSVYAKPDVVEGPADQVRDRSRSLIRCDGPILTDLASVTLRCILRRLRCFDPRGAFDRVAHASRGANRETG